MVDAETHGEMLAPYVEAFSPDRAARYERICMIGSGAFGEVCEMRDTWAPRQRVAAKAIRAGRSGDIPASVYREIQALQRLRGYPNIVCLLDFYPSDTELILIFEYMPSDLELVIDRAQSPLPEIYVKTMLSMLLKGLGHIHANGIIHRDIKPSNCLISSQGDLKIADFGLARPLPSTLMPKELQKSFPGTSVRMEMSHQVATRWYRAPELLFGARRYDTAVDIWSAGMVFAELLNLNPLCPGKSDIDQLYRVLQVRGTPTEETWPGVNLLPDFGKISFPDMHALRMDVIFPSASVEAHRLVDHLLCLDPSKRPTAEAAKSYPYFTSDTTAASLECIRSSYLPVRGKAPKRRGLLGPEHLRVFI